MQIFSKNILYVYDVIDIDIYSISLVHIIYLMLNQDQRDENS